MRKVLHTGTEVNGVPFSARRFRQISYVPSGRLLVVVTMVLIPWSIDTAWALTISGPFVTMVVVGGMAKRGIPGSLSFEKATI